MLPPMTEPVARVLVVEDEAASGQDHALGRLDETRLVINPDHQTHDPVIILNQRYHIVKPSLNLLRRLYRLCLQMIKRFPVKVLL